MATITTQPLAKIRADFDRIARLSRGEPDVLDRYEQWLLDQAPAEIGAALDLGCGTGEFTRALARRARRVVGMDLAPGMIEVARERSVRVPNIEYVVADATTAHLPEGSFDCVASVATLHHMPLRAMLCRLRKTLRPGGVLLILDLDDSTGWRNLPRNALAWWARRWVRRQPPSKELALAWADHGRAERYPRFAEIRALAAELLPGARVIRHLEWRYSIVWTKPSRA